MFVFWDTFRKFMNDPENRLNDLFLSTSKMIILLGLGFVLISYFGFVLTWPLKNSPEALLITAGFSLLSILCLVFLPRSYRFFSILWLLFWVLLIAGFIFIFEQPSLAFAWVIVPFVSVIFMGLPGGIIAECIILGTMTVMTGLSGPDSLWSAPNVLVLLTGLLTCVIGWAGTQAFVSISSWMIYYAEQTRIALEAARIKQTELFQIQEDLVKVNTELARMSGRFKALQQEAEEARQAKAEFVANVSHELRAPLNMIIGFSELIIQSPRVYGAKLPTALLADVNTIRSNSLHLSKLVDDVIDLSQVETGRMALHKEFSSAHTIVSAAIDAVKALYESKGLFLDMDCSPDLPQVFCDHTRVRQILINLLSNAGRFTEKGGVHIIVYRQDYRLVFEVKDTGPGIALEDQQKLFQPFQQVDSSIRRKYGGSGLGLSICKSLVEMHDGKIWMDSSLGDGTTISFSLPLEQIEPPATSNVRRWVTPYSQPEGRTHPNLAPEIHLHPRYVLYEDGDVLMHTYQRYMDDVELIQVNNPEEALHQLTISPSQALIVNKPLDQVSDATWLRNLPYETPAMVCWVPGLDEAAKELDVVDYLLKPITSEMLTSCLAKIDRRVRNLLIVEDEPDLLRLYIRILSTVKPKFHILRATNGQQALELLREHRPDVVLMDLNIPEKDGFQVLQEKKLDPNIREIPVIVITGRDPSKEVIMTDRFLVTRANGFTIKELLNFTLWVGQTLAPVLKPSDQERVKGFLD